MAGKGGVSTHFSYPTLFSILKSSLPPSIVKKMQIHNFLHFAFHLFYFPPSLLSSLVYHNLS